MRFVKRLIVTAVVLILVAGLAGYLLLRASLPQLAGDRVFAQLDADVSIDRDALGVATVTARSRTDAAFATGFIHGQERFFQMDLQRRVGAGELSALLGAGTVEVDRAHRIHRFRHRAVKLVGQLAADDAALYRAYTAGVNAGLESLDARPFEYFLLNQAPQPWRVEDILLTVFSMYFELNDENASRESELGALSELLTRRVYDWLIQPGTDWDAPLRGVVMPPEPLPGPDDLDLRDLSPSLPLMARRSEYSAVFPGSNNWAVSGARSADGRAMLAGDMHLGHAVPNIWFRARIVVPPDSLDITGITLPGTPLIIAGSNGHVAWAFTNSYGDWEDLIVLELDPSNPNRYRTPEGWRYFVDVVEPIKIKGGTTDEFTIRETIWGPVIDEDFRGRLRVLRWLPHLPEALNTGIARFEQSRDVDEAIRAANQAGAPPQNFVVADSAGRIGWTIMGQIPKRSGYDPAIPASWAYGGGWHGWVAPRDYPRVVDPPEGLVWTANARTVDGQWLDLLGQGNHPVGARSMQIRDGLRARTALTIDDMLTIQLDDRALFLNRWRDLLLRLLTPAVIADRPARGELRSLVEQWGGRATTDSAGYRLVRAFRLDVVSSITHLLLTQSRAEIPDLKLTRHGQLERPVWQLVSEQPEHLLHPAYNSWDDYLLAIADSTIDYFEQFGGTLSDRTWGERNTTQIAHPLTLAVPALARFLNMVPEPLPGDSNMPRVQSPTFGASQRMAVSPGNEGAGYFHMPGGQSGHPLSPFYGAGHEDWAAGAPTSFLPGVTEHRLTLSSAR